MKSKHDRPIDNCRTLINCQPVADRIYEEEKLFLCKYITTLRSLNNTHYYAICICMHIIQIKSK